MGSSHDNQTVIPNSTDEIGSPYKSTTQGISVKSRKRKLLDYLYNCCLCLLTCGIILIPIIFMFIFVELQQEHPVFEPLQVPVQRNETVNGTDITWKVLYSKDQDKVNDISADPHVLMEYILIDPYPPLDSPGEHMISTFLQVFKRIPKDSQVKVVFTTSKQFCPLSICFWKEVDVTEKIFCDFLHKFRRTKYCPLEVGNHTFVETLKVPSGADIGLSTSYLTGDFRMKLELIQTSGQTIMSQTFSFKVKAT